MLDIIALILIMLWMVGMISTYTLGGFTHILPVIAMIVLFIKILSDHKLPEHRTIRH